MYSREYQGRALNFEASGGLLNASLVMQDKETDTYWSIIEGKAIAGELEGNPLVELPVASKIQWKDWVKRYPETLVLSVEGREDYPKNAYDDYMTSDEGFRGAEALDGRLETKQEIFAFELDGKRYAVPFRVSEGGTVFKIDDVHVFLYRPFSSEVYYSTIAFRSDERGFEFEQGRWLHQASGRAFSPETGGFLGDDTPSLSRMTGFDTFWYTWSTIHPRTEVLNHPVLSHPGAKAQAVQPDSR